MSAAAADADLAAPSAAHGHRLTVTVPPATSTNITGDSYKRAHNTIGTFPYELLSIIFNGGTTSESQHDDDRRYPVFVNTTRATLPYRLGSVCRHWRRAVLSSPIVWSYVGVSYKVPAYGTTPNDLRSTPAARYFTAVERSGCVPLEVVIHSRDQLASNFRSGGLPDDLNDETDFFYAIFRNLSDNLHRVRSLHVQGVNLLPSTLMDHVHVPVYTRVVDILRARTPVLVDLRIAFDSRPCHSESDERFWLDFPRRPFPLLLPHAPKLKKLCVYGTPIICRRPHPGLPSLRYICLAVESLHTEHLHDLLAVSPRLEHLCLCVEEVLQSAPGFQALRASATHLTTLEIDFGQSFDLLGATGASLPSLSQVMLPDLFGISVNSQLAERIKSLKIWSQTDIHDHTAMLRLFKNVEDVELGADTTMSRQDFFGALLAASDPMWPNLRKIKISTLDALSSEDEALLRSLTARNITEGCLAIEIEVCHVRSGEDPMFVVVYSS